MEDKNIVFSKSKKFALRIVKLAQYLRTKKKEYILSEQVLRAGTSIGANISEGNYGQSNADFHSKLHIALKEAAETEYWLELLHESGYLNDDEFNSIFPECDEIMCLLVAIAKTKNKKE